MAFGEILRRVRLVFDRQSGKNVENEARQNLSNIDRAMEGLGRTARRIGGFIAGALALRALVRFGQESIRMAKEEEAVWSRLGGAIEALGGNFTQLEGHLRAAASAFQAATIHGDDAYAKGLQRVIALSSDVEASIANMGLVANVAAQFFEGDLAPAADIVGRAMIGQTRQLRQLGITTKDAQSALDQLAQRSAGAASRELATAAGRWAELQNSIGDFRETLGDAIAPTEDSVGVLQVLTGAMKSLVEWVTRNSDVINERAIGAFRALIAVLDGTYRFAKVVSEVFSGFLYGALGLVTGALGWLVKASTLAGEAQAVLLDLIGRDERAKQIREQTAAIRDQANAMIEWSAAALRTSGTSFAGAARAATRETDLAIALTTPGAPTPTPPVGTGRSRVSTRQLQDVEEAERALQDAQKEALALTEKMRTATEKHAATVARYRELRRMGLIDETTLTRALADADRELAEETEKLKSVQERAKEIFEATRTPLERFTELETELQLLLESGAITQDTYNRAIFEAQEELRKLAEIEDPVRDALVDLDDAFSTSAILVHVLGDEFDLLGSQESALLSAIQALADEGVGPLDERMAGLVRRLDDVRDKQKLVQKEMELSAAIADATSAVIGAAFAGEIPQLAAMKAKQNAILAAEQLALAVAAAAGLITAAKVPLHLAAAAKFSAVAAAWGGFAAATGGFSGGGAGAAPGRDTAGARSERVTPGDEINIFITGELSYTDPRIQKIVYGATQEYAKNRGNANVHLRRRREG